MTHLIYLSITAGLVVLLLYAWSRIQHWYSKWHSERSRRK